jgi:uncharacterized protein YllA (UPF0747 family)
LSPSVPLRTVYPEAPLAVDLAEGRPAALALFEQREESLDAAIARRLAHQPSRSLAAVRSVRAYNETLGADVAALENAAALERPESICVLAGQQAGFLGGPAYTAYKIVRTIRIAQEIQRQHAGPVIPLFWMATQDHDFGEVNHVHYIDGDGEIASLRFDWSEAGRPIASLPRGPAVQEAYAAYLRDAVAPGSRAPLETVLAPASDDDYCRWHARIWSRLFSRYGLLIVEPSQLEEASRGVYQGVLDHGREVEDAIAAGAAAVRAAGYPVTLDPRTAGRPFVLDDNGRRSRLAQPDQRGAIGDLRRLSPDAALRPVLADALFPSVVNVLGPSELAYHALLRPLYELLSVPQPAPRVRMSATMVNREDETLRRTLGLSPAALLTASYSPRDALESQLSPAFREAFAAASSGIQDALTALRPTVIETDPSLERTLGQSLHATEQALEKLRDRAARAALARHGLSPQRLHQLSNVVRPRDRLQERVLPVGHFLDRFGLGVIDRWVALDDPRSVAHHWLCGGESDDNR